MREVMPMQKRLNQTDIADIKISTRSRDDTPNILKGLQYLYIIPIKSHFMVFDPTSITDGFH